jgi:hypothetical protein
MLDRVIAGNTMAELSILPELGATYGVPLARAFMAAVIAIPEPFVRPVIPQTIAKTPEKTHFALSNRPATASSIPGRVISRDRG